MFARLQCREPRLQPSLHVAVCALALAMVAGSLPACAQRGRAHGFGRFGGSGGFGRIGFGGGHGFRSSGFSSFYLGGGPFRLGHSRTSFSFSLGFGYYDPFCDPFYWPAPAYGYSPYYYRVPVYDYPPSRPGYYDYRGRAYRDDPLPSEPRYPRDSGRAGRDDAEDYYLNRPYHRQPVELQQKQADPGLARAVSDIEAAFRSGDITPLEKHVVAQDQITIQSKGRTLRPVDSSAYLKMTQEAFQEMKTVSFWLDHLEPASNGSWMAYGTHVVHEPDGPDKTFNVSFVLAKRDDNWVITEVSADPALAPKARQ